MVLVELLALTRKPSDLVLVSLEKLTGNLWVEFFDSHVVMLGNSIGFRKEQR